MKVMATSICGALLIAGCQGERKPPVATIEGKKSAPVGTSDKPTPRVDVKHGLDPDAASIDLTPKPIEISELVAMKMPESVPGTLETFSKARVGPFEKSTYRITAEIKSIEHKKDGDFYLIVKDKAGKQAVVEVPDPKLCKGSPLEAKITETRKALEEKYHPTPTPQTVNDPVTVDGVGFFGFKGRPGTAGKASTPRLMPGTGISFADKPKN